MRSCVWRCGNTPKLAQVLDLRRSLQKLDMAERELADAFVGAVVTSALPSSALSEAARSSVHCPSPWAGRLGGFVPGDGEVAAGRGGGSAEGGEQEAPQAWCAVADGNGASVGELPITEGEEQEAGEEEPASAEADGVEEGERDGLGEIMGLGSAHDEIGESEAGMAAAAAAAAARGSVIDKPDIKGAGCQFCRKCFRLDDTTQMAFGAPPTIPDFNLGASGQVCWPLSSNEIRDMRYEMVEVYPNPSCSVFYIKNKTGKRKYLYNTLGQLVRSTEANEMDVRGLFPGVYYVQCEGDTRKVVVE